MFATRPLESPEDWSAMQEERAEEKLFRTSNHSNLINIWTYLSGIIIGDHLANFGSTQTRENTWQPFHSLHKPPSPRNLTLSSLLAAGAHFGHSKSLMNPNFIPYAYGTRAGITIIDLDQTVPLLRRATNLVRAVAFNAGTIVFVGSRPDLRPAVQKASERLGDQGYYVAEKWLPGTLTNKLQMFGPEVVKGTKVVPDLMVFLNPIANMNAIRECAIEHVPTIGIIDSNVDPRIVMYPIPANDESTRTAELIAGILSIAGREGVALRAQADTAANGEEGEEEADEEL